MTRYWALRAGVSRVPPCMVSWCRHTP